MHPAVIATVAAARTADRVSPTLAARLALPLFRQAGPALTVRAHDRAVHETARRSTITVRGRRVAVSEWGTGADVVLLAHGWRGRASQFAPVVRELRAEGYRLVAFDAPANGDSGGRRTDIRDWLAAIEVLQAQHGRFHTIVGHSFGALAALTAVHEGTATGGVIAIAGVSHARYLVDAFTTQLGLSAGANDALGRAFARTLFPAEHEASVWERFDAAAHPLPDGVPLLLVHDEGDREVLAGESHRLHAAHGERSRHIVVRGSGHVRVLGADPTLDAITAFMAGGLAAVDAIDAGELGRQAPVDTSV
ncbi:alpha/beta fold hydrolase [Agromyces italicus]|uniref:alpha/beta fold hydrolase n=1 Tax=Agromyces italicus TaxID=279572 RepID=UPI0003B74161|nr:alpha/beta hydrolase [Agromyces italicus]